MLARFPRIFVTWHEEQIKMLSSSLITLTGKTDHSQLGPGDAFQKTQYAFVFQLKVIQLRVIKAFSYYCKYTFSLFVLLWS